jgi:NAD(P)-dependent dehydrogenase (short-subunit alcohol dehydrogenase family)
MSRLAGKVAVVTGAANGIGAAIAERFAEEGAVLVLLDIDGEGLKRTAETVRMLAKSPLTLVVNVTEEQPVEEAFAEIVAAHGFPALCRFLHCSLGIVTTRALAVHPIRPLVALAQSAAAIVRPPQGQVLAVLAAVRCRAASRMPRLVR